jgi:uncharacterized membrane protein required for colicin V production
MSFVTFTFGIIVLVAVWRGYSKGFVGSITRVVSLLIAYPAAIFLTKPFADFLTARTPLEGLLAYFIAGMAIFLVVGILVTLLLNRLARIEAEDGELSGTSRAAGAFAGLLIGSVVGLVAVYGIGVMRKPEANTLAAPADTLLEVSSRKLVSGAATVAADFVFDDATTTEMTRAFVEDPHAMLNHVQEVMHNEQVAALMADEEVTAMVASGDVDSLMRVPEFEALVNDEHLRALIPQADASAISTQATAETMVSAWAKMERMRNDPEFMAIVSDPELTRQLKAGDIALMTNPDVIRLTEMLFGGDASEDQRSGDPRAP